MAEIAVIKDENSGKIMDHNAEEEIFPAINFVAVKEEPYTVDEQEEEEVTEDWNAEEKFQFVSTDTECKVPVENHWDVQEYNKADTSVSGLVLSEEHQTDGAELSLSDSSKHLHLPDYQISSRKTKVICDVCNKVFSRANNLSRHKSTIHNNIKKYKCDICNKHFSQLAGLNLHKLIHDGIKKYKCDLCNKAFIRSSYLTKHKLSHSGIKNYKCDVCNKLFVESFNLKVHKLIHAGVKSYQCDVCSKFFSIPSTLRRHKLLIHGGIKNYQCDVCNKFFTRSCGLKKHKLIYSGSKKCK